MNGIEHILKQFPRLIKLEGIRNSKNVYMRDVIQERSGIVISGWTT